MAWHRFSRQAIIWSNDGLVYWRKYASLGLNEIIFMWRHCNGKWNLMHAHPYTFTHTPGLRKFVFMAVGWCLTGVNSSIFSDSSRCFIIAEWGNDSLNLKQGIYFKDTACKMPLALKRVIHFKGMHSVIIINNCIILQCVLDVMTFDWVFWVPLMHLLFWSLGTK